MLIPEIYLNISEILSELDISEMLTKIRLTDDSRIETACWMMKKDKQFEILINKEFVQKMDKGELRLIIEHELLHHVRYRNVDSRSHLMTNIVLDIAVNKTIFNYKPKKMVEACKKIYMPNQEGKEKLLTSPIVLACPNLLAEDIAKIEDEKTREAYIDIWGSRITDEDWDTASIPDPISLFYKLAEFITDEQAKAVDNGFGKKSDSDDDSGSRCQDELDDSTDGNSSSDSKPAEESNDSEDELEKKVSDSLKAGKESKLSPKEVSSVINETSMEEVIEEFSKLQTDHTIDIIGQDIIGSLKSNITILPYMLDPTNSTLVDVAIGLDKFMPFYGNKDNGGIPLLNVYVDVSGSMGGHESLVRSILKTLSEHLPELVFLFDTDIAPYDMTKIDKLYCNGGGTSFDDVFEHVLMPIDERLKMCEKHLRKGELMFLDSPVLNEEPENILIITDGYDRMDEILIERIKDRRLNIYVIQIGNDDHNIFNEISKMTFFLNDEGKLKDKVEY